MYMLKNTYRHDKLCRMCLATKSAGPLQYTDFSDAALHRHVILGHESFMDVVASLPTRPAMVDMPGFRSSRIFFDVMHLLWVNGVGGDLGGSALLRLAESGFYGPGSLDERLGRCWLRCRDWLRRHKLTKINVRKFTAHTLGLGSSRRVYPTCPQLQ